MNQARFQKQQREKARREKAAAKFARRDERRDAAAAAASESSAGSSDQAAVLAELAELHERFAAGTIEFEDFSDAKERLLQQLEVR